MAPWIRQCYELLVCVISHRLSHTKDITRFSFGCSFPTWVKLRPINLAFFANPDLNFRGSKSKAIGKLTLLVNNLSIP